MNPKYNALDALKPAIELYNAAQEQMRVERIALVRKIRIAKAAKATQQEIADIVGMSRQRVSQFLAERSE